MAHEKGLNVQVDGNEHDEKMYRMYLKIKKTDNRNVRRQNAKLVGKIEAALKLHPSALICYNLAELYYNGVPGVPTNLMSAMEHYVKTWESMPLGYTFPMLRPLMNNMEGVLYHVKPLTALADFATRMHQAYAMNQIPELQMFATMLSARVADLSAHGEEAIELYRVAKEIAAALGEKEYVLICAKRKAILKASGNQEQTDKAIAKYDKRIVKERKKDPLLNGDHMVNGDEGARPDCIRSKVVVDAATRAKMERDMEKMQVNGTGGVTMSMHDLHMKRCAGCGKLDVENSRQCQEANSTGRNIKRSVFHRFECPAEGVGSFLPQ